MELRVPGGEQYLKPGQAWGDVDALAVQREMIRRTIRSTSTRRSACGRRASRCCRCSSSTQVAKYRQYDETATR